MLRVLCERLFSHPSDEFLAELAKLAEKGRLEMGTLPFPVSLTVRSRESTMELEATMDSAPRLTAWIHKEDDVYVALCPELDIASQGRTVEEAKSNLKEAVELFFETADPSEVRSRLRSEVFVSPLEVAVG